MTLANRTGLAAGLSALAAVVFATIIASTLFAASLAGRVDQQLRDRSSIAPVLAAVGGRIAVSELAFVVDGARIRNESGVVELGPLPSGGLPPLERPGWRTTWADGENWRLFAVEVRDVPAPGDVALVEFVEPMGDVEAQLRALRRRVFGAGTVVAVFVVALGVGVGRRAAAPLTRLAEEVRQLGDEPDEGWAVTADDTPEVAEISNALNTSLSLLAESSRRREEALSAARSFASAASHELRTPLQGAMTNLDVALATEVDDRHVTAARSELDRMRTALDAVRRLSEADLIERSSFADESLGDLVDRAIGGLGLDARSADITVDGPDDDVATVWVDGVALAVENVVRNALRHGRPVDGSRGRIVVTVMPDSSIVVDDDGPGIPAADRGRVIEPFERGDTSHGGSGLGLAFADRVARLHGGALVIDRSPSGGARVMMTLTPPPPRH